MAQRKMNVQSILGMRPGTIIEFEVPFDSELIICAGEQPIGRGQAVKVGERFGLRITSIDSVRARIEAIVG